MAYIPTEWKTGDIVSSQRMNKIENGIANNKILIAHITEGVDEHDDKFFIIDKTWKQIYEAPFTICIINTSDYEIEIINYVKIVEKWKEIREGDQIQGYVISTGNGQFEMRAQSEDDYPIKQSTR